MNIWIFIGIMEIVVGFCLLLFYKQILNFKGPSKPDGYSMTTRKTKITISGVALILCGIVLLYNQIFRGT